MFEEVSDFFIPSIAIIISSFSLFLSYRLTRKSHSEGSYSDLDQLYLEILKIGMKKPNFRNREYTENYKNKFEGTEKTEYETYAHIVWNVCETVYDRTKDDKKHRETWFAVIKAEHELHIEWFLNQENDVKFKQEFHDYIEGLKITKNHKEKRST